MKKVYVNLLGTKMLTFVQVLFFIAAVGCFIYACTWDADYEGLRGTFFILFGTMTLSGLLVIPLKKIVKAAEYYIGSIESENEVVEGERPSGETQA